MLMCSAGLKAVWLGLLYWVNAWLSGFAPQGQGRPKYAVAGQASVTTAIVALVALVTMGGILASSVMNNTKRVLSSEYSYRLFQVAKAGVSEALATRFVPRTNYLAFQRYAGINNNNPPFYGVSGRVFQNPVAQTGLIGVYRYIVLGGDPAANRALGYNTDTSKYLETLPEQPMIVVSKASVCVLREKILTDAITITAGAGNVPTVGCSSGTLQELALSAEADMSRSDVPTADEITQFRLFASDPITTSVPVFIPGLSGSGNMNSAAAVASSFNFNDVWGSTLDAGTSLTRLSVRPVRAIFYPHGSSTPSQVVNITGATTVVPLQIDQTSLIKIIFNGGLDHRTFFVDPSTGISIEEHCTGSSADKNDCLVKIVRKSNGQVYSENTAFPSFPGLTQLLLYPPIPSDTTPGMSTNTTYQIVISPDIADAWGNRLGTEYKIEFTTKDQASSCPIGTPKPCCLNECLIGCPNANTCECNSCLEGCADACTATCGQDSCSFESCAGYDACTCEGPCSPNCPSSSTDCSCAENYCLAGCGNETSCTCNPTQCSCNNCQPGCPGYGTCACLPYCHASCGNTTTCTCEPCGASCNPKPCWCDASCPDPCDTDPCSSSTCSGYDACTCNGPGPCNPDCPEYDPCTCDSCSLPSCPGYNECDCVGQCSSTSCPDYDECDCFGTNCPVDPCTNPCAQTTCPGYSPAVCNI